MDGSRRAVAVLALFVILTTVRGVRGQSKSSSEDLFQLGRAAVNEGKYELARRYFQRSLDQDPALGTLLNLAVCEENLGLVASAFAHLAEALAQAPPADKRRSLIATRMAELDERTPRVTIRAATVVHPEVVVSLDNRPLDRSDLGRALRVDPGRHDLSCAGPGGEQCTLAFTISERESSEHVLTVLAPIPPPGPDPGQHPSKA